MKPTTLDKYKIIINIILVELSKVTVLNNL